MEQNNDDAIRSERAEFYNTGLDEPIARDEQDEEEPVQKVTSQPTGAKRDSYFKRRDY